MVWQLAVNVNAAGDNLNDGDGCGWGGGVCYGGGGGKTV